MGSPIDQEFPILLLTWKRVIFTHNYFNIENLEADFIQDTDIMIDYKTGSLIYFFRSGKNLRYNSLTGLNILIMKGKLP